MRETFLWDRIAHTGPVCAPVKREAHRGTENNLPKNASGPFKFTKKMGSWTVKTQFCRFLPPTNAQNSLQRGRRTVHNVAG